MNEDKAREAQRESLYAVLRAFGYTTHQQSYELADAALQWAASQQAAEGRKRVSAEPEKECCVNWATGTSCFSDPKQNCPRLFPFPRPMETAPKNGTMLRLLVQYDEHSFDDSNDPCWVCGFNLADNTGIDKWQFPGWSWVHDYILEASDDGTPIGWLPMLDALDAGSTTTQVEPAAYLHKWKPESGGIGKSLHFRPLSSHGEQVEITPLYAAPPATQGGAFLPGEYERMTENGRKAWEGVDPQDLRAGNFPQGGADEQR